jgi:hypothetical protein
LTNISFPDVDVRDGLIEYPDGRLRHPFTTNVFGRISDNDLLKLFTSKSIGYLESNRGTEIWNTKYRQLYSSMLNHYEPLTLDSEKIRKHERIITFFCDEVEDYGAKVLYEKSISGYNRLNFDLVTSLNNTIDLYMKDSSDYEFVIHRIRKLIGNTLNLIISDSDYFTVYRVLEKIIIQIARNSSEQFDFTVEFIRNISTSLTTCLDIRLDDNSNSNLKLLEGRCLIGFLTMYIKDTFIFSHKNDIVKSYTMLIDEVLTGEIKDKVSDRGELKSISLPFSSMCVFQ